MNGPSDYFGLAFLTVEFKYVLKERGNVLGVALGVKKYELFVSNGAGIVSFSFFVLLLLKS